MRRRAAALLIAVLTTGALVAGLASSADASVGAKSKAKLAYCAGGTKSKAVKAIKDAYSHFLNGKLYPTATDKEPFIQYLSGKHTSPTMISNFEASSAKNAAASATTDVQVNTVKCTGKKKADVAYDLVLSGTPSPGLAPPGTAVLDGKVWKVSAEALCNLQALGDPSTLEPPNPCADVVAGTKPSDLT